MTATPLHHASMLVAELLVVGTPPECTVHIGGELTAIHLCPVHTHHTRLELVRRPA